MSKEVFKIGDKVFHLQYGWGEVEADAFDYGVNQQTYKVHVRFLNKNISFTFDGKEFEEDEHSMLSFTEYTLKGFSQERPIELPEVGELCLVRDYEDDTWLVREFAEYRHGLFICQAVHGKGEVEWKYMKRIKILD